MRIRQEVRLVVVGLLGFQLMASGGAVLLLGRMSPAIAEILTHDAQSVHAVEQMTLELSPTNASIESRRARFDAALARAKENQVEPMEGSLLAELERLAPRAIGDPADPIAVGRAVEILRDISELNRTSMRTLSRRALRLGNAGAWAEVLLGLSAFALAVILARRIDRSVVSPLAELLDAVRDHSAGDRYRRCRATGSAEINELAEAFNDLLDRVSPLRREEVRALRDRTLLNYVIDRFEHPLLAVDSLGEVVAANRAGFEQLDHDPELARAIANVPTGGSMTEFVEVAIVEPGELWLVRPQA
jgi:HAMP domain-containing protein